MRKLLVRLVKVPALNLLLRAIVKSFAAGSKSLAEMLMRNVHVSGTVTVVIEKQKITFSAHGDDALVTKLYYKHWEKDVTFWFAKFSTKYCSICDAGANIGVFSLLAVKVNRDAIVHAFEPNPNNFLRLKRNIVLNAADMQILPIQAALGNRGGSINFYLPADGRISDVSSAYRAHATSFNDFAHREIQVPVMTLDDFCKDHGVAPDLIKIDVELYELQVLEGMRSLMTSRRPYIFCEIFNDEVKRKLNPGLHNELEAGYTEKIGRFLESVNYSYYAILPGGILEVDSLRLSPVTNMYLLLPKRLKQQFYLHQDAGIVLNELSGD